MVLTFFTFSMLQVREALGVTLSVLFSNIRLCHSSYNANACDERNNNVDSLMEDKSWVKFLTERAAEAVVNIQTATQSDKAVNPMDTSSQNGHLDGDSQDDMKWMETVLMDVYSSIGFILLLENQSLIVYYFKQMQLLHFIISSLKSGRSSYLLDVIVGLLYPVISLQVWAIYLTVFIII